MHLRVVVHALGLAAALVGCGQPSNPPGAGPGGMDDAVKTSNDVNASIRASSPVPADAALNVAQVGSHRVKTICDVSTSTVWRGESTEITLGDQKLTADFATGRLLAAGAEKAKLPAGMKELEVRFVGGKLTASADGAALLGAGEGSE